MLFWLGAALSGLLGYKLHDLWVPAAVAAGVVAIQALMFRLVLADGSDVYKLLVVSLIMNLVMFYATFGIGRAIGQRVKQRRKGVR